MIEPLKKLGEGERVAGRDADEGEIGGEKVGEDRGMLGGCEAVGRGFRLGAGGGDGVGAVGDEMCHALRLWRRRRKSRGVCGSDGVRARGSGYRGEIVAREVEVGGVGTRRVSSAPAGRKIRRETWSTGGARGLAYPWLQPGAPDGAESGGNAAPLMGRVGRVTVRRRPCPDS